MPKKKSKGKTKTRELPPGGGGDKSVSSTSKDKTFLPDRDVKHHSKDEITKFFELYDGFLDNFVEKYLETFNTEDMRIFDKRQQGMQNGIPFINVGNIKEAQKYTDLTDDLIQIINDKNSLIKKTDIELLKMLVNKILLEISSAAIKTNDFTEEVYLRLLSLQNPENVIGQEKREEIEKKNKTITGITVNAYISGRYSREQTINKLQQTFEIDSHENINEIMDDFDKKYKGEFLKLIIISLDSNILTQVFAYDTDVHNFPEVLLQYITNGDIENAKKYLHNILYIVLPKYRLFSESRFDDLWKKIVNELYDLLEYKINSLIKIGNFTGAKKLLNNFLSVKLKNVSLEDDRDLETKIKISIDNASRRADEIGESLLKEEREKLRLKEERLAKNKSKQIIKEIIDERIHNAILESKAKAIQKEEGEKLAEESRKIYNPKTPTMYDPPSLRELAIAYPTEEFIEFTPNYGYLDQYYKSLDELSKSYPLKKLSATAETFMPKKMGGRLSKKKSKRKSKKSKRKYRKSKRK